MAITSRPKLPSLAEVLALATKNDCDVSIKDLARMHKNCEMSAGVVKKLWPHAKPRIKAAYMGLNQYRSSPCVRCSSTQRYTTGTQCVGCVTANKERYCAENPEKANASKLKWQKENAEYHALRLRAWRALNPEKIKQYNLKTRAKRAAAKEISA